MADFDLGAAWCSLFPKHTASGHESSNSFSRRFSIASFELFAPPFNQSSTACATSVCVTLGLFTSTERCAAGPGAQSSSRKDFRASTATS
jgi:hypothetical protein